VVQVLGTDRIKQYCQAVLEGTRPANKWEIRAVERHLADLERFTDGRFYFDLAAANRAIDFVESLPHIKGEWARRKELLKLEPWQCFIIGVFFGWKRADGFRRFRTFYGEVARKNAKSTCTSAIMLYALAADGEAGAECYSAATTRDQARIVFRDAQAMAKRDPDLREALGVSVGAHSIHVLETSSRAEALSAEGNTLDGLNIHFAGIDEFHAHPTRDVWEVIETATGARRQPIIWIITTAGGNRSGVCYEIRTYLTKILDGIEGFADETFFGIIYTIDEGDDWTDPASWVKANPNFGVSVMPDDLERKARKAQALPGAQPGFLTKHLNVWVSSDSAFFDMRRFDACRVDGLTLDQFKGQKCWIGLDLASRIDIAVAAIIFQHGAGWAAFVRCYLPEDTIDESGNSQYKGWVRAGHLQATDGAEIDYEVIKADLIEWQSDFQVEALHYDPWQAHQLAHELTDLGFPALECRMNASALSEPMKDMQGAVQSGRFAHDGNPLLAWAVSNVEAHEDAKGNVYPRKARVENKIDPVVAVLMARSAMMRAPAPTTFAFFES
jgi:phage terminase large subunit-like protein